MFSRHDGRPFTGGSEGSGGRVLIGEAQVVLHNQPRNAQRAEQGRPPVNSLWFWGGGVLPDAVRSPHAALHSGDEIALALADAAGIARPLPAGFGLESGDEVLDLQEAREIGRASWRERVCQSV